MNACLALHPHLLWVTSKHTQCCCCHCWCCVNVSQIKRKECPSWSLNTAVMYQQGTQGNHWEGKTERGIPNRNVCLWECSIQRKLDMSLQANIYYDKILLDLFSIHFAGNSVMRNEAQLTQKRLARIHVTNLTNCEICKGKSFEQHCVTALLQWVIYNGCEWGQFVYVKILTDSIA